MVKKNGMIKHVNQWKKKINLEKKKFPVFVIKWQKK